MNNLRKILADEGVGRTAALLSLGDDEKKVQRAIADGNSMDALHYLGNILSEVAWAIKELEDPQAEMVMDAARKFTRMHR